MPQKIFLNILIKRLEGKTELLISKVEFDQERLWTYGTMEEIIILE